MPMPYLHLRWWSKPLSKSDSPTENDSDSFSSPERPKRRVSLHIAAHPADRALPRSVHHNEKAPGTPTPISNNTRSTNRLSHDDILNEKFSTHHLEPPAEATDKVVGLLRSTTNIHKSSSPTMKDVKPSLIRRVTSKLRITVPATSSSSQPVSSVARPSHSRSEEKDSSRPPRSPRVTLHHSPTLPNSFVSREKREAALRERGLRPPRKDLSEQEREADERLGLAPLPVPEQGDSGSSAASKIKEEWLFMNRSIESGVSDNGPAFYPRQPNFSLVSGVALSHVSESMPRSSSCDSDCIDTELKPEISFIGRSSISSSVPPLSQSSQTSHLEVLQEEPAEHVPPTSPHLCAQPPIVITPVEDSFPSIAESPISCTFSSHLAPPGSQPHSPLPAPSDKENSYSSFPGSPVRRRTTNSSNRSHSPVGTTLSRFGTNSLTNLRRSVIGSIRHAGSSADLSTSSSQRSSPRMAISPTMHNRGSIVFEAKGIEDAESRRLSELAFLD